MRTFPIDSNWTALDVATPLQASTPIELELYTVALARVPCAFFGLPQYGEMRRPGVLWVDAAAHERLETEARRRLLSDDGFATRVRDRFNAAAVAVEGALAPAAEGGEGLPRLWLALCDLMPFMAVNWLLPHDGLRAQLQELVGFSGDEVEPWISVIGTTSQPPHFIRFRSALLELARQTARKEPIDSEQFALDWGKCQTSVIQPAPLEDPARVAAEAQAVAAEYGDGGAIEAELARLAATHEQALARRRRALDSASRRALARGGDLGRLAVIAELLQFAVDEEEERHVLQMRALTILRRSAEDRQVPLERCSTEALGLPQLLKLRPRQRAA